MATPPPAQSDPLQPSAFRNRLILFLLPYFLPITSDYDIARAEVLETLESYGARTRSEMINAAMMIAFSFSALDMLAETKATQMSPSMRLRYASCANSLKRSCQQIQTKLAKGLTCDTPAAAEGNQEPAADVPDAEAEAALQCARATIETYRNRLSGARPTTGPYAKPASQGANKRLSGGAMMMDALASIGPPAPPA